MCIERRLSSTDSFSCSGQTVSRRVRMEKCRKKGRSDSARFNRISISSVKNPNLFSIGRSRCGILDLGLGYLLQLYGNGTRDGWKKSVWYMFGGACNWRRLRTCTPMNWRHRSVNFTKVPNQINTFDWRKWKRHNGIGIFLLHPGIVERGIYPVSHL